MGYKTKYADKVVDAGEDLVCYVGVADDAAENSLSHAGGVEGMSEVAQQGE